MSKRKDSSNVSNRETKKLKEQPTNKFSHHRLWLIKSDPPYDIRWMTRSPNFTVSWDGVRNAEARNIIRDCMKVGHYCLFYLSGVKQPAIQAIVRIVKPAYEDATAHDKSSPYYCKTQPSSPWLSFDVQLVYTFDTQLPLSAIKGLTSESIAHITSTTGRVVSHDGNGISKDVWRFLQSDKVSLTTNTPIESASEEDKPTTIVLDEQDEDDDVIITNHCQSPGTRSITKIDLPDVPSNVSVDTLKEGLLKDLVMLHRNRLSISPVTPDEWNTILIAAELYPAQ